MTSNHCPKCNKFVPLTLTKPKLKIKTPKKREQIITADIKLILSCSICNTPLKERVCPPLEFIFECCSRPILTLERIEHFPTTKTDGHNRYSKTFYGRNIIIYTKCKNCKACDFQTQHTTQPAKWFDKIKEVK